MNQIPLVASPGTRTGDMLYRTLGRTGERVSAIGIGGFHLAQHGLTEEESIRLVRAAIDRGITFMDNSWDYNEGQSELRMGKALKDGYRQKVFLMTKIDGRTKALAQRQIETSLERLQTDHIDLVQHHEIIRFDDPDRVFAEGGANEALVDARKAGKIRYIGFTGHKDPHIHLYMLKVAADHGFQFDTAQMPLNQAIEAAKTFKPMNREQMAQVLAKTKEVAWRASMNYSRLRRTSTPQQSIRIGWAATLPALRSLRRQAPRMSRVGAHKYPILIRGINYFDWTGNLGRSKVN